MEAIFMRILICRPDHYDINYKINPWMNPDDNPSESEIAWVQWERLADKINCFAEPVVLDGVKDLPDMVFTANAGLILKDKKVILSHFKHEERNGEESHFKKFFEENGYEVLYPKSNFEGAGDALYLKDVLVGGFGFRTDESFYDEFFDELENVIKVKLVDPYFYHLDTCFCPLNDKGDYMIYPNAFELSDLKRIREIGNIEITVPEEEAREFACNAVVIGDNVILPSGCEETEAQLQSIGFETHPLRMTEYIKAGGACKCLTLKL